jgi:hypothetical protein
MLTGGDFFLKRNPLFVLVGRLNPIFANRGYAPSSLEVALHFTISLRDWIGEVPRILGD